MLYYSLRFNDCGDDMGLFEVKKEFGFKQLWQSWTSKRKANKKQKECVAEIKRILKEKEKNDV